MQEFTKPTLKSFTFHYDYTEPSSDRFECQAESLDEAWKLFDVETKHLDDVEVDSHEESEIREEEDPRQMKFDFSEPTTTKELSC